MVAAEGFDVADIKVKLALREAELLKSFVCVYNGGTCFLPSVGVAVSFLEQHPRTKRTRLWLKRWSWSTSHWTVVRFVCRVTPVGPFGSH